MNDVPPPSPKGNKKGRFSAAAVRALVDKHRANIVSYSALVVFVFAAWHLVSDGDFSFLMVSGGARAGGSLGPFLPCFPSPRCPPLAWRLVPFPPYSLLRLARMFQGAFVLCAARDGRVRMRCLWFCPRPRRRFRTCFPLHVSAAHLCLFSFASACLCVCVCVCVSVCLCVFVAVSIYVSGILAFCHSFCLGLCHSVSARLCCKEGHCRFHLHTRGFTQALHAPLHRRTRTRSHRRCCVCLFVCLFVCLVPASRLTLTSLLLPVVD